MNRAEEIKIVAIKDIIPNSKNRNNHPPEQIERLKKIIEYQGFRVPIIISNQSGRLVAGHGRLLAAKALGLEQVPALYQDFESDEQEYAAGISDNSVAAWAELDLSGINTDIGDLGPDFDIDFLGLKNFEIEPADRLDPEKEWQGLPEFEAPEQQSKIIIIIDDENRKEELLRIIGAKDYKKFKERLWSLHWPQ